MRGVGGVRKLIHQSWLAKLLGLGLLCWGFKGVQEEIPREEASTLQIGSVAFPAGQYILVTDYLTKMGIKTVARPPKSPDLAPCAFAYSLSSEAAIMKQWEDERGFDEGHWHSYTTGLPWGLPEAVGTVQQVHCSWRRILRRGLEFHECTINRRVHTKKVWKLI